MLGIPDDPIISCIERTGYPSWFDYYDYDDGEEEVEEEDEDED